MGLSCSGNFLKFLVFFFNGIVFLGGGVMAGYGIYLLVEAKQSGGTISVSFPAIITGFGFLLFLVGFLGCFGACHNNTCMLITFAVVVGLLLVAEIVCGLIILVYRNEFVRVFGDHLEEIITEHENDNVLLTDTSITALNEMQKRGCAQAIYNEVKDSTLAMGIIILIIALIQIGAIICASCLAKKVNE